MPNNIEHFDLIWRAKNGDRQALQELFRAYYETLCRMAQKLAWNRALAQDLVQETMVSAIKGFSEYRMECQFLWWLKRILYRRYADHLRKSRNEVPVYLADEDPHDASVGQTRAIQVRQTLAKLPKGLRITAELRFLMDWKMEEISKELKIPLGTVKSRLNTIRQIVKTTLSNTEGMQ